MTSVSRTLCLTAVLAAGLSTADAATILFVPQDNRPVSFSYTVHTATAAGYDVITPPENLLSDNDYQGEPDRIWDWVNQNVDRADALVLSTDTLIYGGLVDSRKHNFTLAQLERRLQALENLARTHRMPIYAFGTIMRSPKASNGSVEPFYYADYGTKIYEITYWQDKRDTQGLSPEESAKLLSLTMSVPIEYLQDWFNRRSKNNTVNERLIDLAATGRLTYFCLGHDDTSTFSQSTLESRYLKHRAQNISAAHYGSFPGADQLGLLLIARYDVDRTGVTPKFKVIYPLGGADRTMPHYENQSAGETIADHIQAVGGTITETELPDILLAVNTPLGDVTGESAAFKNLSMPRQSASLFLERVEDALHRQIPVSVADIFYSNGADNTLLEEMGRKQLLFNVTAYNGWNTASNTIGYAIAQAVLARHMSPAAHERMLIEQYLDNWGYQANVRKDIYRKQDEIRTDNVKYYGELNRELEELMIDEIQQFAESRLHIDPRRVSARFPWKRLFETEILVADTPSYPRMSEIFAERKRLEEERVRREQELEKQKAAAQAAAADTADISKADTQEKATPSQPR